MKRSTHAVGWVLLAVAAFALWPQRWGGSMTYVVTSGTSMEPGFVAGDLAVLRASRDYGVGDIVAYRSAELDRIVMHRITAESPAGYALKGDNNDFVDPSAVTDKQVLGRLVLRVPAAGKVIAWLVRPLNLVILAGALVLLVSDRRTQSGRGGRKSPGALGVVRLTGLELPAGAVTASVASADELTRLAAHYDRPVLVVDGDGTRCVLEGTVLYVWREAVVLRPPVERRSTPQGRDWAYAEAEPEIESPSTGRHLATVPAPRAAEQLVS